MKINCSRSSVIVFKANFYLHHSFNDIICLFILYWPSSLTPTQRIHNYSILCCDRFIQDFRSVLFSPLFSYDIKFSLEYINFLKIFLRYCFFFASFFQEKNSIQFWMMMKFTFSLNPNKIVMFFFACLFVVILAFAFIFWRVYYFHEICLFARLFVCLISMIIWEFHFFSHSEIKYSK